MNLLESDLYLRPCYHSAKKPSDISIVAIPPELMVDTGDIEAFGLSNSPAHETVMYQITTARAIWVNLFWQTVRNNSFESTKIAWRTNDGVPSRQSELATEGLVRCIHLLPGGRWLISVLSDGQVVYYDLESTTGLEERELIPAQLLPSSFNMFNISVDVGDTLPMTGFNLAVYMQECVEYRHDRYHGLKIWNVGFVFEDQDVTGLQAAYLKSLPVDSETINFLRTISLLDRHLAFSGQGYSNTKDGTFVVEWSDIADASLQFPRKCVDGIGGTPEMHLLPKQRIISRFRNVVCLSDYSDLPITTSMVERSTQPHTNPELWEHRFPDLEVNLSRLFSSQDGVRLMSLSSEALYDIQIKDTDEPFSESHVTVERLISIPLRDQFYDDIESMQDLGPERGVLYTLADHDVLQLHLLEYVPGVETPDFVAIIKTIKTQYDETIIHRPLFDPGSGRLVIFFVSRFVVVDFALIYKPQYCRWF